jgi:cytochrome c oxidase cbb3-type subunit 2
MPAFTWLANASIDGQEVAAKMRALRRIGVPYTDPEIAAAAADVGGHNEMDALVAYLQMLKFHGDAVP